MTPGLRGGEDGAHLMALQLVRVMVPGVLAHRPMDEHLEDVGGVDREVLQLWRDFAAGADTRTEVAPAVLALGTTTVALLHAVSDGHDQVEEWLRVQADTVDRHTAGQRSPDPTVIAVARALAPQLAPRPAPVDRTWEEATTLVTQWVREGEHGAADRYALALSAAQLTAWLLAGAMNHEPERMTAYLDAHSRALMARNGGPAAAGGIA